MFSFQALSHAPHTFVFATYSLMQNLTSEDAKISLPGSSLTLSESILRNTKVNNSPGIDVHVYWPLPGNSVLLPGLSVELNSEAKYKNQNSFSGNEGRVSPIFAYLNLAGKVATGFEQYSFVLPDSFIPYFGVGLGSVSYTENPTNDDYYSNVIPEHLNSKGLSFAYRVGAIFKWNHFILGIDHRRVRGRLEGSIRPPANLFSTLNATPVKGILKLSSTSVKLGFTF